MNMNSTNMNDLNNNTMVKKDGYGNSKKNSKITND